MLLAWDIKRLAGFGILQRFSSNVQVSGTLVASILDPATYSGYSECSATTQRGLMKQRNKGTGSVTERNGKFKAQFPVSDSIMEGQRIRKFASKTCDTREEAEQWLRGQLTDRDRQEWVEPNKITVSQLLEKWLEVVSPGLAPNTLKEYQSVIRNRINHPEFGIGNVIAQKLTAARIDSFYAALRKPGGNQRRKLATGLSETSIKRTHEILTGCLGWANKRELLVKNPCESAGKPKANRSKPKAWNAEQLNSFLAQPDRILQAGPFWSFLAHTGVRLSEALGLLWEDVDFGSCTISINRRTVRLKGQREMLQLEGTKTQAGTRAIDVDPSICRSLREWKLEQGSGGRGLVFPFHCDAVDREFTRRVAACNPAPELELAPVVPDFGIHCLRHTHATLLLKAGTPAKVVSERLGHSDVAFTLRQYQTVLPGMGASAAQSFVRLLEAQ